MNTEQLVTLARDRFGLDVDGTTRELFAGNINLSAVLGTTDGDIVLQRLNTSVFTDIDGVVTNIEKILDRLARNNLPALQFFRTTDGGWVAEENNIVWRCYRFVDGSATPAIKTPEDAQATARAFGRYARAVDELDLVEHLPGYHDFDSRIAALETEVERDDLDRAAGCDETISTLFATVDKLRLSAGYEARRSVPRRNAHNDAKGPNCIVGPTGARTIIDLDTTMPGTVLSDIGELVRSSTRYLPQASPEQLMGQIEAVNRGFLVGYGRDLLHEERDAMLLAGPLLAVENAARFLADHLGGDKYYGAQSPDENLARAQAQQVLALRLIEAVEWATTS